MKEDLFYDFRTAIFFKGDLKEVQELIKQAEQNHCYYKYLAERFVVGQKFDFEALEPIEITPTTKVLDGSINLGNGNSQVIYMVTG